MKTFFQKGFRVILYAINLFIKKTAEILRSFFVLFLLFDISEEIEELLVYLGGREFLELKLAEVYSLSLLH